jgi:2-keto-4-pentenoate hydratase/2-oxohepta-3-ene-1,7-dioic acid hydratase in catechol pathway
MKQLRVGAQGSERPAVLDADGTAPDRSYLRPGDRVELEIDGRGRAGQRLVAASG